MTNAISMARTRLLLACSACLLLASCSDIDPGLGEESPDSSEEAAITDEMISIIRDMSQQPAANNSVPRFNQAKSLGCVDARFEVEAGLPAQLAQGLFARPGDYEARLRFANASRQDDQDKDFRGLAIKVSGVEGEPLWGERGEQDFLLNSYPALFAANPAEFLAFMQASSEQSMWKFLSNPLNWDSALILLRGRERIASPFGIRYWSTTPYRLGGSPATAVKYSVQSCSEAARDLPEDLHENYLREAMQAHLAGAEACLDFMVQFQQDAQSMPVEDASVIWDEQVSPFRKVARMTIAAQDFTSQEAMLACENLTFNPWQALPEHRPIGGINRVRRPVYAEAAAFRLEQNRRFQSGQARSNPQ